MKPAGRSFHADNGSGIAGRDGEKVGAIEATIADAGNGAGSEGAFIRSMIALNPDRSVDMIRSPDGENLRFDCKATVNPPSTPRPHHRAIGEREMSWDREFDEPVPLPLKKQARTLREAADYVMKLPKSEQDLPEWKAAVSALMIVAEHQGPPMFARIGMMQALNRGKQPTMSRERKYTPWGRRPLKRDR